MSGFRCQGSGVRRQESGVQCHIFFYVFFLFQSGGLVVGGSVINGAYLVKSLNKWHGLRSGFGRVFYVMPFGNMNIFQTIFKNKSFKL